MKVLLSENILLSFKSLKLAQNLQAIRPVLSDRFTNTLLLTSDTHVRILGWQSVTT